MILESNILKENAAKMQTPAVWKVNTSYNQRFFEVSWRGMSTMVKIYQALDDVDSTGFRRSFHNYHATADHIEVAITAAPAYLASGAVHLLAGKSGDDLTRMLFLPWKRPPKIKCLRVALNQNLDELAIRSAKRRRACLELKGYPTAEDASDIVSEEASVSTEEDGLGFNEEERSETRLQEAAMSADKHKPGVSDSD